MNGFDDELRSALGGSGGGGGGGTPEPPPFDDVRRRARAQQRSRRALAGAGLAVVLVATGAAVLSLGDGDDGPDTNVITDGPDEPTTTTVEAPEPDPTPGATPTTPVPPGDRPDQIVAIDEHGRLVVVDAATGEVIRELDAQGDPTEPVPPEAEIGPNVLDDVALSPDGFVYYTSVGEPASGSVLRRLVDGSSDPAENLTVVPGNDVAVRGDGGAVAGAVGVDVALDIHGESSPQLLFGEDADPDDYYGAASWSLDGQTIAVESTAFVPDHGPAPTRVAIVPIGSRAEVVVTADDGRSYVQPAFRRDGAVAVAEQDDEGGNPLGRVLHPVTGEVLATFEYGVTAAVVDQSYDATGTWLLVTFDDGTMRWYGGGQSGVVPGAYRAGDW